MVIHLERVADCLHMVQLVLLHTQNPISFLAVVLFLAMAVLVFTSLFCHVCRPLCDGKSYFPSLIMGRIHVTVSLDPTLSHCVVVVAIHCWVDLCSGNSPCCSFRVLILVLRYLDATSARAVLVSKQWSCLHHCSLFITATPPVSLLLPPSPRIHAISLLC